jgi:hypothetical protein
MASPKTWNELGIRIVGTTAGLGLFALWVGKGIPFMMRGPPKKPRRLATWENDKILIQARSGPKDSDHKVMVRVKDGRKTTDLLVAHGNSGLVEDLTTDENISTRFHQKEIP